MLTRIREKTQGIIATFIMALIAIPFALWGINSYFDAGSNIKVAEVGDTEITLEEYRNELDRLRPRLDPALANSAEFKQSLLNRLIEQSLIVQDAERQGFRVANTQLAEVIRRQPSFQRDGKFDPTLYEALLRQEGMRPEHFEAKLRGEVIAGHLQTGISESRVITPLERTQLARLLGQERDISYALIDTGTLMAKDNVSAQDIERYYSEHPNLFRFPDAVRVEYLRFSPADLGAQRPPTEEDLKRVYAEEAARFTAPEKRRASHILISLTAQSTAAQAKEALSRMEEIAAQVRGGTDFAALARKHSMDSTTAQQGGDLGEVRRGLLPKELEDAVYALKVGGISQPVRTSYGYHLVKLTAHVPEKRKAFEEVRRELVEVARRRLGEEQFFDKAEKFRNMVYEQPDSLAPTAKALGLEIHKSDWFTQAGGTGIASNPKIVQAAFEPDVLNQSRNSDAIELSVDTLVAVRVAERRPAGRQPLSEVRVQIERIMKQERALQQARKLGEAVLNEARSGAILERIAAGRGYKYIASKTLTRLQSDGTDAHLINGVFRIARPSGESPVYELVPMGTQGFAVVALKRVREPSGKLKSDWEDRIRTLLETRRGAEYFNHYRAGLRLQGDVKIYPGQL